MGDLMFEMMALVEKSNRLIPQKGVWFEVVLVVCCIMPLISWLDCFFKQSLAKEPSYQSLLELSALVDA